MNPRLAWGVAIACALAVAVSCAVWVLANPLPSYYDEALYAIYAIIDVWATRTYGLAGAERAMVEVDPGVPPAMRVLALPLTAATSPSLALLRAISLVGFFAAAGITAMAVRRVAGATAGALALAFLVALPILVLSTRMFGTEYPLLLALSLLLLALASRHAALLVAASVALGLLAKPTYLTVGAPMLIAAAVLMPDRRRAIALGAPLGFVVALTWWWQDASRAIPYSVQATRTIRHSLGPWTSPATAWRYLVELLRCDFGYFVALAIALIVTVASIRRMGERLRPFVIICAAGALPLLFLHYTSVNHNPRYVAAPVMLLAAAAAALASKLPPRLQAAALALAALQVGLMTMPRRWTASDEQRPYIWRGVTEMMAPVEQWEWTPLRDFALRRRGWPNPRIAILGEGYAFNPPQIRYAWRRAGTDVAVRHLYAWDIDPPFDLGQAIERAATAQLVVTAPGYRGEATDGQVPNNRYNAAFAAALANDPRFDGPFPLDVGLRRPAVVQVFVRR